MWRLGKIHLLGVCLSLLVSCGFARPREIAPAGIATVPPTPDVHARLEFAHTIPNLETWQSLAARPSTSPIARTEVLKFLVDVEDQRRLYFVDTERWEIHYFFARDRLGIGSAPEDHERFNAREYRMAERRFELGTITRYLDSGLLTLELISGDTLSGERIVRLFEQVRDALSFCHDLAFRPLSELHERSIAPVRDRLPIVDTSTVFAGIRYQPLTLGVGYGTLRFVRGPLDIPSVRSDDILVLEHVPEAIPIASGLITAEFQAPLGHLAVSSASRNTPNMALRDALDHPALRALEGQVVELVVGPQEFTLRAASPVQAEANRVRRRLATPPPPPLDLRESRLIPVCQLRMSDVDFAGAKASHLGEACRLGGAIRTPGGFVVPFARYVSHLESAGVDDAVAAMLAHPSLDSDLGFRSRVLESVRERIRGAPVDVSLLGELRRRTRDGERWIFRSSTNAEDLLHQSGAGLYESVVVSASASDDELADAIREVWASIWSESAFEERRWHRVDHARVAMAVLIQPFLGDAIANGVAITTNPFFRGRPGYFINASPRGGSVTGAGGDELPEQHLVYTYSEVIESELLSRSTRMNGQPLLREADLLALAEVLTLLHAHFVPRWGGGPELAVDVEFLVRGPRREIIVLQARPYLARISPGQE